MDSYQELEKTVEPLDVIKQMIKKCGMFIGFVMTVMGFFIIALIPLFIFALILFYSAPNLGIGDSIFFGFITYAGLIFGAFIIIGIIRLCKLCYDGAKKELQEKLENQNKIELEDVPEKEEIEEV